jgi:uncharacterized membrane protein YbhN (UPF0104 family)
MAVSAPAAPGRVVEVVDAPRTRVRRPGDLVGFVVALAGIAVVLVLAVYAHGTTEGVTEDVQSAFARILRGLVQIPLGLLQIVVTLVLPWIVLVERVLHKAYRQVVEALAAGLLGGVAAALAMTWIATSAPASLAQGFTITTAGVTTVGMSPYACGFAAFLTAAGSRTQRRSVAWSWNLLWFTLLTAVITNDLTLPGALVTVLIGRAVGLGVRYGSGVYNERAYGVALVEGVRRAGLDPVRVVRVGAISATSPPRTTLARTSAPIGYAEHGLQVGRGGAVGPVVAEGDAVVAEGDAIEHAVVESRADDGAAPPVGYHDGAPLTRAPTADDAARVIASAAAPSTLALERPGQGRVYAVTDVAGGRWDVVALDGDRQVIGALASVWSAIRLRGLERRTVVSLRQAAERAALLAYAATAAGVRSPGLVGLAEIEDSVVLAHEHVTDAVPFTDLDPDAITDQVLADAWAQLRCAHAAGLAHRDLTSDVILVRDGQVWIAGWTNGDVASSELARRLDIAQMLAVLALRVGPPRAVASAAEVLQPELLGAIAPLLQPVALPQQTRVLARGRKGLLEEVRASLIELMPPAAEAEPVQLARFSPRTVVTTTIAVAAVWVVLSTLNIGQLTDAVAQANPMWAAVAFALGLFTYVGAALSLIAFAPVRLGLWRTTLVQAASSVVALVTPAGVGPAALNLRYLNRRKVDTPLAVASVALIQVSQFVVTIAMLLLIAAVTGTSGAFKVPGATALIVMGAIVAVVGGALAIPSVRRWAWARSAPTLRQVWPRVLWVVGQPGRLGLGLLGNVIMTGGFIAAFAASLAAFGQSVPPTQLAIIYLGGTALGSAVPTPGGLGTVELALSGGLTAAGIPAAVAASIAVLFRLLTFWARIPVGWAAMRYLQRKNDL